MWGKTSVFAVLIVILAVVYNSRQNNALPPSPVIDTKLGQIRGLTSLSRGGREFYEFLGVPYAQPPVGQLRFEV